MTLGVIGTIACIVVGGAVGAVTIIGVVSSTVDSSASHPGNVVTSTIQYGSTK